MHQHGIFNRTHAMSNAFSPQRLQSAPHTGWSRPLARMRSTVQTRGERSLKPGCKLLRRITRFTSTQAKRNHPITHTFNSHLSCKIRPFKTLGLVLDIAHNIKDPTHLHPKFFASQLTSAVQTCKIDIVSQLPSGEMVCTHGERHLSVTYMLPRHLFAELIDNQLIIISREQTIRNFSKMSHKMLKITKS